ncbi:MAG: hypothetical protein KDK34_17995 [Leptospiraceae bacterium]|nr:hypothetical protein [Leptospiraceae bacterium]
MSKVDLVFRSVGERTASVALELARRHIRPDREYIIDNVRPFSAAVEQMLRIDHDCDQVVYVDADCLIMEDMRLFLNSNTRPYTDCYVNDRFRGHIHCGVHITRIDVVRKMAELPPPDGEFKYVLRPESRRRYYALRELNLNKEFWNFRIYHDWFQSYVDIFAKYALRELRSRTEEHRKQLEMAMQSWDGHADFIVARRAIQFARESVAADESPERIDSVIKDLPQIAEREIPELDLPDKGEFSLSEVEELEQERKLTHSDRHSGKIFGLGLSRTGTRSLTSALQIMGYNMIHYPIDEVTYNQLAAADYNFELLKEYDGITDITVSPYYMHLDRLFPGSKFILTLRDKESWLVSAYNHWLNRPAYKDDAPPEEQVHLKVRRILRAAVYGCYDFNEERFSYAYDQHVRNVREYFRNRPDDYLELDIVKGDGWEKLCPFLGQQALNQPFPHKGNRLSASMAAGKAPA